MSASLEILLAHAQACHHRCLLAALGVAPAERILLCQEVARRTDGTTLVCSHRGGIIPAESQCREWAEWAFADHNTNCLGGTFAACVFFDIPQASAETLWAACETVRGGGIVCLVLPANLTLNDCMHMETEAVQDSLSADQKLGEALLPRLVNSLWRLPCGFVDRALKLLAASRGLLVVPENVSEIAAGPEESPLLQLCCTPCQEKALRAILEAVSSKSSGCQRVLSLTGRRGRGKSSVAGLGLVAALQRQRSVVVTGPGCNSVQGMFRFAANVLNEAPADGQLQSLMFGRARFLHAETVPGYVAALSAVDDAPVLIVDEMASLAIPTLHQLLSAPVPLVLLLGTLSGAEGTGAAIQEKVFKELTADSAEACHHATLPPGVTKRDFVKLSLHQAVRYKPQDPVESWLDSLLFLDVPAPPSDPKAYGTLKAAAFLEIDTTSNSQLLSEVMGLLRGHYRTSPNDLARLVSDSHIRTFALVGNGGAGPPAVAVVAIEETPERLGKSGAKVHQTHLLANGVEKEYPHLALARLSGLRPWRVVASPALRGRGFGQKALELLERHVRQPSKDGAPAFDWLGVSFGLTAPLFRFWSRAGYRPVVMSNTPNDQTGEMSIKMLLPISAALERALPAITPLFGTSFYRRLATCFRDLDPCLVVEILASSTPPKSERPWRASSLEAARLEQLARARRPVEEVARNYDMFHCLASAYFLGSLEGMSFPKAEEAALCAVGAQTLSLEVAAERLGRGSKAGDRQNDVAARLRSVAKEVALHIGALDVECLLTIAPREQDPAARAAFALATFQDTPFVESCHTCGLWTASWCEGCYLREERAGGAELQYSPICSECDGEHLVCDRCCAGGISWAAGHLVATKTYGHAEEEATLQVTGFFSEEGQFTPAEQDIRVRVQPPTGSGEPRGPGTRSERAPADTAGQADGIFGEFEGADLR
eukprot:s244_g22.t1